jgi:hypothetical protein
MLQSKKNCFLLKSFYYFCFLLTRFDVKVLKSIVKKI